MQPTTPQSTPQPLPQPPLPPMPPTTPQPTPAPQPAPLPQAPQMPPAPQAQLPLPPQTPPNPMVQAQMQNLAENNDFSIATISEQANRIQGAAPQYQPPTNIPPLNQPVPPQNQGMALPNPAAGMKKPVFAPDPNNPAVQPNTDAQYQAFDDKMYDKFKEYQEQQKSIPKPEKHIPPMLNQFATKPETTQKVFFKKEDEGPQISFHN